MKEFFQFRFLIAVDVLPIFYALCALIIPIASWYFLLWLIRRYAVAIKLYQSGQYSLLFSLLIWIIRKIKFFRDKIDEKITWRSLSPTQKLKFIAVYLFIVIFAELFLRLTFEYLIAYIHMHEWMKPHDMLQ